MAASNCSGNWNFANKYFSIAGFSNKLASSFRYLVPLLLPRPHLYTPIPTILWNERKSTPF